MNNSYAERLRQFEQAKRELENKPLTAVEYEMEVRKLAMIYDV